MRQDFQNCYCQCSGYNSSPQRPSFQPVRQPLQPTTIQCGCPNLSNNRQPQDLDKYLLICCNECVINSNRGNHATAVENLCSKPDPPSSSCNCCACNRCPICLIKRLCKSAWEELEQAKASKQQQYPLFEGGGKFQSFDKTPGGRYDDRKFGPPSSSDYDKGRKDKGRDRLEGRGENVTSKKKDKRVQRDSDESTTGDRRISKQKGKRGKNRLETDQSDDDEPRGKQKDKKGNKAINSERVKSGKKGNKDTDDDRGKKVTKKGGKDGDRGAKGDGKKGNRREKADDSESDVADKKGKSKKGTKDTKETGGKDAKKGKASKSKGSDELADDDDDGRGTKKKGKGGEKTKAKTASERDREKTKFKKESIAGGAGGDGKSKGKSKRDRDDIESGTSKGARGKEKQGIERDKKFGKTGQKDDKAEIERRSASRRRKGDDAERGRTSGRIPGTDRGRSLSRLTRESLDSNRSAERKSKSKPRGRNLLPSDYMRMRLEESDLRRTEIRSYSSCQPCVPCPPCSPCSPPCSSVCRPCNPCSQSGVPCSSSICSSPVYCNIPNNVCNNLNCF